MEKIEWKTPTMKEWKMEKLIANIENGTWKKVNMTNGIKSEDSGNLILITRGQILFYLWTV